MDRSYLLLCIFHGFAGVAQWGRARHKGDTVEMLPNGARKLRLVRELVASGGYFAPMARTVLYFLIAV